MCYLEDELVFLYGPRNVEQPTNKNANHLALSIINTDDNLSSNANKSDKVPIADLETFFLSIGSIFITYITSSTLNNLLLSKVIRNTYHNNILYNNSLLSIFSSQMDMIERSLLFNKKYGKLHDITIQSTIWNLSYFNHTNKDLFTEYKHKTMMKMMITYICANGMHPFLGINCDSSPNCQWSNNPQCRIRLMFEKLLASTECDENEYNFGYRNAWEMRANQSNLLIDANEMIRFLFTNTENDESGIGEYDIFDMDAFHSFDNEKFTLFAFKNECDYTYKIQFDIIHCNKDLNVIDNFTISLFGKKIRFGSFPFCNQKQKNVWNTQAWHEIKQTLLGHKFVNINHWYIISIQSIDTSVDNVELNKCYYLICAEVNGTYVSKGTVCDEMYSKLLVWKTCFFSEQQPYTHE